MNLREFTKSHLRHAPPPSSSSSPPSFPFLLPRPPLVAALPAMISMRLATLLLWACFAWRPEICGVAEAFTSHHPLAVRSSTLPPLPSSSLPTPTEQEQALDDYLPPDHPLHALLGATAEACAPRRLDTTEDVHEVSIISVHVYHADAEHPISADPCNAFGRRFATNGGRGAPPKSWTR